MGTKAKRLFTVRNRPPEDEPWVWLTREFFESEAWRTAPINTRRVVERLMLEHMANAGKENGRLICTYEDFIKAGIGARLVHVAIKDAARRGLIVVTQKGKASAGQVRWPSNYALGWLPLHDGSAAANRWLSWQETKPSRRLYAQDIDSTSLKAGRGNHGNPPFPTSLKEGRTASLKEGGELRKSANPHLTNVMQGKKCREAVFATDLPPGWTIGEAADRRIRILTPEGVGVPMTEGVGDQRERDAYDDLALWNMRFGAPRGTEWTN